MSKPAGFRSEMGPFKDEHYYVRDEWDNEYTLYLGPRLEVLRLLAAHEFAEAVGLLRIPVHPVLVIRGQNNVPLQADVLQGRAQAALFDPADPGVRYNVNFGDDFYTSALLLPRIPKMQPLKEPETLIELTDTIKQILFRIAIGARSLHFGILDDHRQHFLIANGVLEDLHNDFDWNEMKFSMKFVPYQKLQALSQEEAAYVIDEVSRFLDRVEWVGANHLESLFGPAGAVAWVDHGVKVNYIVRLKKRIEIMRAMMQRHFHERIRGHFKVELLKRPLPRDVLYIAPRIPFSRSYNEERPLPAETWERRANARNLLECFFHSTLQRQREIVLEWGKHPAIDGGDPIAFLMNEAEKWDGTTRIINSHIRLATDDNFQADPDRQPQLFLNPNLPRTLVVWSPNDPEGREVGRVLREVEDRLPLTAMPLSLRPGQKVNRTLLREIIAVAKEKQVTKIVFGEVRLIDPNFRQFLQNEGFQLEFIDHHQEDGVSTYHPYSWLEQLLHRISYQPDLRQMITGLMDRSGIHAFLQIRWDMPVVNDYIKVYRQDLWQIKHAISGAFDHVDQDVVLILKQPDARFSALNWAYNWDVYPKVANALVFRDHSMLFFGKADIAMPLYDHMKATEGRYLTVVMGGDIGSNVFLIFRVTDNFEYMETVAHRVKLFLQDKTAFPKLCAIEIAGRH